MPQEDAEGKRTPSGGAETKPKQETSPSGESILDSASSFVKSLFGRDDDNSRGGYDIRNDINQQLNEFEELQILRKNRRKMLERQSPSPSPPPPQQQQRPLAEEPQEPWPASDTDGRPNRPTKVQNLAGITDRVAGFFSSTQQQTSRVSYRAADGAYYVISQDPREGARIDVQPPFMMPKTKENGGVRVEVVQESGPCQIRWRRDTTTAAAAAAGGGGNDDNNNYADQGLGHHIAKTLGHDIVNNSNNSKKKRSRRSKNNHPLIELDDYVDCAKLSASVYRTRNLLTLTAPAKPPQPPGDATDRSAPGGRPPPPRYVPVVKRS